MTNDRIIKSYVWYGEKCFFVSTIERDSSCVVAPSRYNETIVWEYNWATNERGNIVHQDDGPKGSIKTHLRVCEAFHKYGCVRAYE